MIFEIDERIFEKFPATIVGVIVAKGINNQSNIEELQNLIRQQEDGIRAKFNTETLSLDPKIEVWRKAYSSFGAKPKEHKSSVENLYRVVLNGSNIRHINTLVDIYNLISLKYMVPAGAEDLDKVEGDISLTFAGPEENPILMLGDKEERPPHIGEVIYKDGISTICRRWNWREADRTKLTKDTQNCILVIEGFYPISDNEVRKAARELMELIQRFCGGNCALLLLDKNNQKIAF